MVGSTGGAKNGDGLTIDNLWKILASEKNLAQPVSRAQTTGKSKPRNNSGQEATQRASDSKERPAARPSPASGFEMPKSSCYGRSSPDGDMFATPGRRTASRDEFQTPREGRYQGDVSPIKFSRDV